MTQLWPCHRRFQEPSFRDWSDFAKCLGPWDGGPCTVQDSLNWVLFVRNFEVRERETCNHIVSYRIISNLLQLAPTRKTIFVMICDGDRNFTGKLRSKDWFGRARRFQSDLQHSFRSNTYPGDATTDICWRIYGRGLPTDPTNFPRFVDDSAGGTVHHLRRGWWTWIINKW